MIIYNTTVKVSHLIHHEWLTWLKDEYIPAILNTGCFISADILQLLETDDTDGHTYAIQYRAESKSLYNRYIEKYGRAMQQISLDKWGNEFIAFSSLLKVVN